MNNLHKHTVGLAVGATAATIHAIWAVVVALVPQAAQGFLDWDIALHFVSAPVQVMPFTLGGAVMLIVVAFIVGYIVGRIFACCYNWAVSRGK